MDHPSDPASTQPLSTIKVESRKGRITMIRADSQSNEELIGDGPGASPPRKIVSGCFGQSASNQYLKSEGMPNEMDRFSRKRPSSQYPTPTRQQFKSNGKSIGEEEEDEIQRNIALILASEKQPCSSQAPSQSSSTSGFYNRKENQIQLNIQEIDSDNDKNEGEETKGQQSNRSASSTKRTAHRMAAQLSKNGYTYDKGFLELVEKQNLPVGKIRNLLEMKKDYDTKGTVDQEREKAMEKELMQKQAFHDRHDHLVDIEEVQKRRKHSKSDLNFNLTDKNTIGILEISKSATAPQEPTSVPLTPTKVMQLGSFHDRKIVSLTAVQQEESSFEKNYENISNSSQQHQMVLEQYAKMKTQYDLMKYNLEKVKEEIKGTYERQLESYKKAIVSVVNHEVKFIFWTIHEQEKENEILRAVSERMARVMFDQENTFAELKQRGVHVEQQIDPKKQAEIIDLLNQKVNYSKERYEKDSLSSLSFDSQDSNGSQNSSRSKQSKISRASYARSKKPKTDKNNVALWIEHKKRIRKKDAVEAFDRYRKKYEQIYKKNNTVFRRATPTSADQPLCPKCQPQNSQQQQFLSIQTNNTKEKLDIPHMNTVGDLNDFVRRLVLRDKQQDRMVREERVISAKQADDIKMLNGVVEKLKGENADLVAQIQKLSKHFNTEMMKVQAKLQFEQTHGGSKKSSLVLEDMIEMLIKEKSDLVDKYSSKETLVRQHFNDKRREMEQICDNLKDEKEKYKLQCDKKVRMYTFELAILRKVIKQQGIKINELLGSIKKFMQLIQHPRLVTLLKRELDYDKFEYTDHEKIDQFMDQFKLSKKEREEVKQLEYVLCPQTMTELYSTIRKAERDFEKQHQEMDYHRQMQKKKTMSATQSKLKAQVNRELMPLNLKTQKHFENIFNQVDAETINLIQNGSIQKAMNHKPQSHEPSHKHTIQIYQSCQIPSLINQNGIGELQVSQDQQNRASQRLSANYSSNDNLLLDTENDTLLKSKYRVRLGDKDDQVKLDTEVLESQRSAGSARSLSFQIDKKNKNLRPSSAFNNTRDMPSAGFNLREQVFQHSPNYTQSKNQDIQFLPFQNKVKNPQFSSREVIFNRPNSSSKNNNNYITKEVKQEGMQFLANINQYAQKFNIKAKQNQQVFLTANQSNQNQNSRFPSKVKNNFVTKTRSSSQSLAGLQKNIRPQSQAQQCNYTTNAQLDGRRSSVNELNDFNPKTSIEHSSMSIKFKQTNRVTSSGAIPQASSQGKDGFLLNSSGAIDQQSQLNPMIAQSPPVFSSQKQITKQKQYNSTLRTTANHLQTTSMGAASSSNQNQNEQSYSQSQYCQQRLSGVLYDQSRSMATKGSQFRKNQYIIGSHQMTHDNQASSQNASQNQSFFGKRGSEHSQVVQKSRPQTQGNQVRRQYHRSGLSMQQPNQKTRVVAGEVGETGQQTQFLSSTQQFNKMYQRREEQSKSQIDHAQHQLSQQQQQRKSIPIKNYNLLASHAPPLQIFKPQQIWPINVNQINQINVITSCDLNTQGAQIGGGGNIKIRNKDTIDTTYLKESMQQTLQNSPETHHDDEQDKDTGCSPRQQNTKSQVKVVQGSYSMQDHSKNQRQQLSKRAEITVNSNKIINSGKLMDQSPGLPIKVSTRTHDTVTQQLNQSSNRTATQGNAGNIKSEEFKKEVKRPSTNQAGPGLSISDGFILTLNQHEHIRNKKLFNQDIDLSETPPSQQQNQLEQEQTEDPDNQTSGN